MMARWVKVRVKAWHTSDFDIGAVSASHGVRFVYSKGRNMLETKQG